MTKKSIYSWVGVVSGIVTILLAFTNPFSDKAKLSTYVRSIEYVPINYIEKQSEIFNFSKDFVSVKIANTGELPAKNVHVQLKRGYEYAILVTDHKTLEFKDDEAIYIEKLEVDTQVELMFWVSSMHISPYNLEDVISVSSQDSGKSILRTDINGSGVAWFIEDYFIFIIMTLVLLFYLFLFLLSNSQQRKEFQETDGLEVKLEELSYAWSVGVISEEEFQKKSTKITDAYFNKSD